MFKASFPSLQTPLGKFPRLFEALYVESNPGQDEIPRVRRKDFKDYSQIPTMIAGYILSTLFCDDLRYLWSFGTLGSTIFSENTKAKVAKNTISLGNLANCLKVFDRFFDYDLPTRSICIFINAVTGEKYIDSSMFTRKSLLHILRRDRPSSDRKLLDEAILKVGAENIQVFLVIPSLQTEVWISQMKPELLQAFTPEYNSTLAEDCQFSSEILQDNKSVVLNTKVMLKLTMEEDWFVTNNLVCYIAKIGGPNEEIIFLARRVALEIRVFNDQNAAADYALMKREHLSKRLSKGEFRFYIRINDIKYNPDSIFDERFYRRGDVLKVYPKRRPGSRQVVKNETRSCLFFFTIEEIEKKFRLAEGSVLGFIARTGGRPFNLFHIPSIGQWSLLRMHFD